MLFDDRFFVIFFLLLHFLWVLAVIIPVPIIIVGGLKNWAFVRNPWFRYIHLSMILIVVFLTILDIECPLTTLENYFRERASIPSYQAGFIANWIERLLYHQFPPLFFLITYIFFALIIVALLIVVKPRRL